VILAILAVTTVASLVRSRRDPTARAHAGSLRAHPSRPDPESQPDTAKRP
jgi:tellurite resistance protein TerC